MRKSMLITAFCGLAIAAGSAGDLDATFGTGGVAIDNAFEDIRGVAALADGSIVAVGPGKPDPDDVDFLVTKVDAAGARDTSFGTNGYVAPFGAGDGLASVAHDVARDGSGRLVAVGFATEKIVRRKGKKTTTTRTQRLALVRMDADGALDASFGTGGAMLVEAPGSLPKLDALAFQSDGKIVAVGTTTIQPPKRKGKGPRGAPTSAVLLVRFHADGTLDTSFGADGFVVEDTSGEDHAAAVAVQSNDALVVVGVTAPDGWLRRYDSDGAPVGATVSLGTVQVLPSVAVDVSDRILVAAGDGTDGYVVRYTAAGALDGGFARYETGLAATDALRSVDVLADGSIVCAGQTFGAAATGFVVRLLPGGGGDTTFGANGVSAETDAGAIFCLAVLPGGDYVIGGLGPDGLLARYCAE